MNETYLFVWRKDKKEGGSRCQIKIKKDITG